MINFSCKYHYRLKDGQPLAVDGKHIKQIELEDGTVILQIDEATDADTGKYSCVAKNAEGDNTSTAPLAVLGENKIISLQLTHQKNLPTLLQNYV